MSQEPSLTADEALLRRILTRLEAHLEIFDLPGLGYVFALRDPSEAAWEGSLAQVWRARGELLCHHTTDSAQAAGFSLHGDATLEVRRYPEFTDEADFIAAILHHLHSWFHDHPGGGWTLDVREPPAGGWTDLIRHAACASWDATEADVFPEGSPGPIERLIFILDDGNARCCAVRAAGTWLVVDFETS